MKSTAWSWQPCGTVLGPPDEADHGVPHRLYGVAVSPDGQWLVGTTSRNAFLWRIAPEFADTELVRTWDTGMEMYAQFSSDSRQVAISGDGNLAFYVASGERAFVPEFPVGAGAGCYCGFLSFSHDGKSLAGSSFGYTVNVWTDGAAQPVQQLPSPSCNTAAGFSADDSLLATSTRELFRTSDWSRVWPNETLPRAEPAPDAFPYLDSVQFAPSGKEALISNCSLRDGVGVVCTNDLYSVTTGAHTGSLGLTKPLPVYSPDGNWVVAGGEVSSVANSAYIALDAAQTAGAFAPNGDIITGGADGNLQRWCRQSSIVAP